MRTIIIVLLMLTAGMPRTSAQDMNAKYTLTPSIGYGTENNWGNTGYFGGLGISSALKKRWLIGGDLTYFTTAIYNAYKANPTFYLNEDRKYHSLFLNLNLQYVVGKESSLINAKIKAGPALKYYDTKILLGAKVYYNPNDKLHPIVPGSEKYYEKQGVNVSLYTGVSFDFRIKENLKLGAFLDVYSGLIPIEHFMPGINATFLLRK